MISWTENFKSFDWNLVIMIVQLKANFKEKDIWKKHREKTCFFWKMKFWNQWNIHNKRGNYHNRKKTFDDSDHFDTWHLGIVLIIVSSDFEWEKYR